MAKSKIYAVASATADSSTTFGHLNITIYELFPYRSSCSLKITCQMGGFSLQDADHKSYGWDYGLSNDYGLTDLYALKEATTIMRRIQNNSIKEEIASSGAFERPQTFGEYALRVLRHAGVRRLHINEKVNKGFSTLEDLPVFHVIRNQAAAAALLNAMEQEVIYELQKSRSYRQW